MNKIVFLLMLCFVIVANMSNAQVGIGTTSPNPSSILDITSQNKGILIPRTDTLSVVNPAKGLIICDSNTATGVDYFYFNGVYWQSLGENAGTFLDSFNGNRPIKRPNWTGVTGVNVGTTTNVAAFLNAVFFPFISATININGNVLVEIGTSTLVTISGVTTPNDETVFSNGRVDQVFPSTTTIYSFGAATTYSTTFTFTPLGSTPATQEYRFVAYQGVANNGVAPFVINSATKFVQSVYPYLHTVSSINLTAGGTNAYSGLNKLIQVRSNKTITHNSATNGFIYFMYPASYGTLTSILDQNSFEQITAFTRFTANVTSVGLTNDWTTSYYIYKSNLLTLPANWNYIYRY